MSLTTELIERLRKEADGYIGKRTKRAVRVKHILREAADTIETLSAKVQAANMERSTAYYNGGWIPVSERLPEEDGQYLITVKYKHVNDSYQDVYAEHGEWYDGRWDMFCFGHCGEVEEIIAWMPLPAPYKPQESGVLNARID